MAEIGKAYNISGGKPDGKRSLRRQSVNWSTILT
jgi:hypothetical protein